MPGILHARTAGERFRYARIAAAPALAPFVAHYWTVSWDLDEPHTQHVLPYPSVNVTFTTGGRCRVAGVPRGRFTETLTGAGRVFGARFVPGGFHPFWPAAVSTVTGRFVPVADVYGPELGPRILAADDAAAVRILDDFLLSFRARADAGDELIAAVVARVRTDPGMARVDRLAAEHHVGVRRLQRLFADRVGIGPKWLIRRYRLHEAAERAARGGEALDLIALAAELGYSDQAHLTRDFTALIGDPPARYARAQWSGPAPPASAAPGR